MKLDKILYLKILCFAGFLRVQIHSWKMPTIREPCSSLHQGEEQPDSEPVSPGRSFFIRYLLE